MYSNINYYFYAANKESDEEIFGISDEFQNLMITKEQGTCTCILLTSTSYNHNVTFGD